MNSWGAWEAGVREGILEGGVVDVDEGWNVSGGAGEEGEWHGDICFEIISFEDAIGMLEWETRDVLYVQACKQLISIKKLTLQKYQGSDSDSLREIQSHNHNMAQIEIDYNTTNINWCPPSLTVEFPLKKPEQ